MAMQELAETLGEDLDITLFNWKVPSIAERSLIKDIRDAASLSSPDDIKEAVKLKLTNERLLSHYNRRDFLKLGYLHHANIKITHVTNGKQKSDVGVDPAKGFLVMLAPHPYYMKYILALYQNDKSPVLLVREIYPDGRVISCTGSWKGGVNGLDSTYNMTLDELEKIARYTSMVELHKPFKENYAELKSPIFISFYDTSF